jgi:hypothetical protein
VTREGRLVLCLGLLWVACGGGAETGPAAVHWDRDTCERCGMTISDRRFAAQVRGSRGQAAHRFDDPGCALLWLDERLGVDAEAAEIWVRDRSGERWLDGRSARYVAVQPTPMNYGFAATDEAIGVSFGLGEVRLQVRVKERERRDLGR